MDSYVRADITLIERTVARDERTVGDLYDRHSRLLYGLILRVLRDRGEAEEVLQEVFLLVWTRAETYNVSLGSPAAWLVRIARNRAIDRPRARRAVARATRADRTGLLLRADAVRAGDQRRTVEA
jgi:RNA polymerase sigma-70 factor, ECF subfamily